MMKKRAALPAITLSDCQKKALQDKIEAYYQEEYGENVGILRRERIMQLFLEEMGPVLYNRALDDAHAWAKRALENLDADYILLYKEKG